MSVVIHIYTFLNCNVNKRYTFNEYFKYDYIINIANFNLQNLLLLKTQNC